MSSANLPTLNTKDAPAGPGKKLKSGTVAERVVWMSRTSDVHGSHLKTDLDSYLALIRRKIQEKCATTVELITQIRRNKIGDSGHVTPNEFRFTLIKFGIILPQPLVDRIFNVFDSDRSGTMDFDEFAMWIMNSEFRPAMKNSNLHEDTPRTVLRGKLQNVVQQNRALFLNMKRQVSFLEFVSDITRLQLPLTDKEARAIFQTLDPKDLGFIDSKNLLAWADSGRIITESVAVKPADLKAGSLEELIKKIIGRNSKQFELSFAHIQQGQGIKISFDEFRRCLLNAGVGKNIHDVRQLFLALGGQNDGLADIDLLFRKLAPIIVDPVTEVSEKPVATSSISTGRADRALRDRMRKCFKQVKADIDAADAAQTGYIDAERLYKILVKRCMPLTFQDFRFVVQQIKKEPGSTRIDYQHFLHGYNPQMAPHQLDGNATLRGYESKPLISTANQKSDTAESANGMGLSSTMPASGTNPFASTGNSTANLASLRFSRAADDIDLRNTTTRAQTADHVLNGGYTAKYNAKGTELKRIWQSVLRECHRSDPERCGQVSRNVFIAALEKSDLDKAMSAEAMSKLADTYMLSNGLVNYLHLFRSYLNDQSGGSTPNTLSKSQSALTLFKSTELAKSNELKPIHPVHPWDYGYERTKHPAHPYWQQANLMPRLETVKPPKSTALIPPPNEKGAGNLSVSEKEALLSQFHPKVLTLCQKCYKLLAPIWRPLRNQFKKDQIASQRGSILTPHFLSILETNGIMLTKGELATIVRSFRGLGMQDVVKYDEFLRVCMLTKDRTD